MRTINLIGQTLREDIAIHMNKGTVGLVYFDLVLASQYETNYGKHFIPRLIEEAMRIAYYFDEDMLTVFNNQSIESDFFLCFRLADVGGENIGVRLHESIKRLQQYIEFHLNRLLMISEPLKFNIGYSEIAEASEKTIDSTIYMAAKQAIKQASKLPVDSEYERNLIELKQIIKHQIIYSVYQPIVSLVDAQVYGYEALSRGPKNSVFHSPLTLFTVAEKEGALYQLDTIARQKAVQGLKGLDHLQKVFINIPAQIIHDPQFTPGQTRKMIEACGLSPEQIVFEITERSSIEDFATAKKILSHYRAQGYQIAIDDAGAGYSSLLAIAELQPDYIKIERVLIQNIHQDKHKEIVLETFIAFAHKLNIPIIAEGIEQPEELEMLIKMGVQFGQGYYIRKPSEHTYDANEEAQQQIITHYKQKSSIENIPTIASIAQPIVHMDETTLVSEVWHHFEGNPRQHGVVITQYNKPIGLIMREKLYSQLGIQYGWALYWHRPVVAIMDAHPLIVNEHLPVEHISEMAMTRENEKLYDLVIVSSNEKLYGVVTIRSILEYITNKRLEDARVSNPLTGLPGNLQIHKELNWRLNERIPFFIIYADLDHFKDYNDLFGFYRGDELIQYTARSLLRSVASHGNHHDFVGHIGGDDFVVVSTTAVMEELCQVIIRQFEAGIEDFYSAPDESHGKNEVMGRDGQRIQYEGMTLSLSVVIISEFRDDISIDHISQVAAELKKEVKEIKGSAFMKHTFSFDERNDYMVE